MSHVRQQIREAVKGALATVAEVSTSRTYPVQQADLPILLVYTNDEEIVTGTHGAYHRNLDLVVEAITRGEFFDDDLDELIAGVEVALNRSTLGGICKPLFPTGIAITADTGSTTIGRARMTYRATYFTESNTPAIAT